MVELKSTASAEEIAELRRQFLEKYKTEGAPETGEF